MDTPKKFSHLTHQAQRDKAATTTAAALDIIGHERSASEAKVARLRALRLAQTGKADTTNL